MKIVSDDRLTCLLDLRGIMLVQVYDKDRKISKEGEQALKISNFNV